MYRRVAICLIGSCLLLLPGVARAVILSVDADFDVGRAKIYVSQGAGEGLGVGGGTITASVDGGTIWKADFSSVVEQAFILFPDCPDDGRNMHASQPTFDPSAADLVVAGLGVNGRLEWATIHFTGGSNVRSVTAELGDGGFVLLDGDPVIGWQPGPGSTFFAEEVHSATVYVPEPTTTVLLVFGGLFFGAWRLTRRRRQRT